MRLNRFFRRRYWDQERAHEIKAYLEIETAENIARGMSPEDARYAARRKFGNPTQVREEIYRMNTISFVETLWQDLRYGARLLRLNPGFAIVALLSLALGIGANTAVFQLINAVRLRSLPVPNPEELASIRVANREWAQGSFNGRYSQLTNPLWEQIRERQQAFSQIAAWAPDAFNLAEGGQVRYAEGLFVSGDFFHLMGVAPLLGRVLDAADDQRGCGSPGAVISHGFWQSELGGDPAVLGRRLTVYGRPFEVIGVTPAGFYGVEVGRRYDVAIPLCSEPAVRGEESRLDRRHGWWLAVIGRLKPGWSIEKATAHLGAISPALLEATIPPIYSAENVKHYVEYRLAAFPARSGFSMLRESFSTPLWLLMAIAGLVLLIACANLANLMLARASAREREIAVRLALGASRGRLIRQLLAESLLLAIAGAAAGAFLAPVLSQSLISFLSTQGDPLFVDLHQDWRVLAFAAGLAMLTCTLFGLTPSVRATRAQPASAMKAAGRGLTAGRERFGLRRALVVSQVAFSCVLLVGALLFVRSLRNLLTLDAGFQQQSILVTQMDMTPLQLPVVRRNAFQRELLEKIRALPEVESAAETNIVPISENAWIERVVIDGEAKDTTHLSRVTPGYFETLGIPLLGGRDFDERDTATSAKVAIVNEQFAKQFFEGENPIGKTFQWTVYQGDPNYAYEIVGLVKNTKYLELRENFRPLAFVPASQNEYPDPHAEILIRSNAPLAGLLNAVKHTVAEISPAINIDFRVFKTQIHETLRQESLMATLSGFFGALAVLLATIGLYGVMSYLVARRRNEIGIRMALGAGRSNVVAMILREAGWLVGIGLTSGTLLAFAAARAASGMLFGLGPNDPATLLLAVGGLAGVALVASYLPARRAANLDPTAALREE